MIENPEILLDRTKAGQFLSENAKEIFNEPIRINEIERSYTYNPDSYNLLYKIEINGQIKLLRLATSKVTSKEQDYRIMDYFYRNDFNQGKFVVSKPLAFLEKFNLLIYENAEGMKLTDLLYQNESLLREKVKSAAELLKKVHSLPLPEFPLWKSDKLFEKYNTQEISRYYPKLSEKIPYIIDQIKKNVLGKKIFCHGDFNPNNLIFSDKNLFIIDFGSTCAFVKEIDLSSFFSHLKIMLKKIDRSDVFENLKKEFFTNYSDCDLLKFNYLSVLIDLRLLEITIIYKLFDYNEKHIPVMYKFLTESLEKISIKI